MSASAADVVCPSPSPDSLVGRLDHVDPKSPNQNQVDAMTLVNVEYEFVDDEEPSSDAHELNRQIRLQFADSPAL